MSNELTPKQKQTILDNPKVKGTFSASIGRALHADAYDFCKNNEYKNFSTMIAEAVLCLMKNGSDWRGNESENGKLDRLIYLVENMKVVRVSLEAKEENEGRKLNTSGGFSVE